MMFKNRDGTPVGVDETFALAHYVNGASGFDDPWRVALVRHYRVGLIAGPLARLIERNGESWVHTVVLCEFAPPAPIPLLDIENVERADRAKRQLHALGEDDERDELCDFLANLMHLRGRAWVAETLERATRHFEHESL